MFEHVGQQKLPHIFMKKMKSLLKDDGLFLLHTIGSSVDLKYNDAWVDKYIFPGGLLPSVGQIGNGYRPAVCRRGLAQLWRRLRHDAHGVVRQF
jgi:cyclopropane fatty-acyl-phospholipid synthase-like methyltransferase